MNKLFLATLPNYPYFLPFIMLFVGFFLIVAEKNLIKKVVGLNLIQAAVIVFYILVAYIDESVPPIYSGKAEFYTNPLPHVLMLTAIVVGIATTALAFTFIYIIYKNYQTIDEQEIMQINLKFDQTDETEITSINLKLNQADLKQTTKANTNKNE